MFWSVCLLVFLGIVSDVLAGAWTRSIVSRKGWYAAGFSFILDALSFSVLAVVWINRSIVFALAWFVGRAIGSKIAADVNINKKTSQNLIDPPIL